MRASSSRLRLHHGKNGFGRPLAGVSSGTVRLQTLPDLVKTCKHLLSRLTIGSYAMQLDTDSFSREILLHQLRHNIALRDQVRHGEAVYLN